jgi:hypothetical protein
VLERLGALVGTRLTGLGRAASLQWFEFTGEAGARQALHVECSWRLVRGTQILVGRIDYFRGATAEIDAGESPDEVGSRWRDIRNEHVRGLIGAGWMVQRVDADDLGSISVWFADGTRLEIFPDASHAQHDAWESWRIFALGPDSAHFVVGSAGVRVDGAT